MIDTPNGRSAAAPNWLVMVLIASVVYAALAATYRAYVVSASPGVTIVCVFVWWLVVAAALAHQGGIARTPLAAGAALMFVQLATVWIDYLLAYAYNHHEDHDRLHGFLPCSGYFCVAASAWFVFLVIACVHELPRGSAGQCESCGYSLRGLPGSRCPECGQPFDRNR